MNTKIFSSIATPRLIIRPIVMTDANAYFEAEQASIKELSPHWNWVGSDKTVNDIKDHIRYAQGCHLASAPQEMYFSILTKGNHFLGSIWLYDIFWFVPHFEILYWLDTREMGKGYMTEAVNALTRACFILYRAKRVQVRMSVDNKRSRAIVDRLGFKLEGEMANYFIDFDSNKTSNGLLYACCSIEKLPLLDVHIIK